MKFALLLIALLLPFASGNAQTALSMSVLAGLRSVRVSVGALTPEAEKFGLGEDGIAARTKRALSTTTLQVASAEAGSDVPELIVDVRAIPIRGPSHLYTVEVAMREYVKPERELPGLDTFPAATWSKSSVGIANSPETVLNAVATLVEAFASEHRRENR